jgi:hypothetical protein
MIRMRSLRATFSGSVPRTWPCGIASMTIMSDFADSCAHPEEAESARQPQAHAPARPHSPRHVIILILCICIRPYSPHHVIVIILIRYICQLSTSSRHVVRLAGPRQPSPVACGLDLRPHPHLWLPRRGSGGRRRRPLRPHLRCVARGSHRGGVLRRTAWQCPRGASRLHL